MKELDYEFFEQYKKLDKLCQDMYSSREGLSYYIKRMEDNGYLGVKIINGWLDDYYRLKHLRYVRNRIAHDNYSYDFSKVEDLDDVINFYERILRQEDPLCLLNNFNEKNKKSSKNLYRSGVKANRVNKIIGKLPLFFKIILVFLVIFYVILISYILLHH